MEQRTGRWWRQRIVEYHGFNINKVKHIWLLKAIEDENNSIQAQNTAILKRGVNTASMENGCPIHSLPIFLWNHALGGKLICHSAALQVASCVIWQLIII